MKKPKHPADKSLAMNRLWAAAHPIKAGDPVDKYLTSRNLMPSNPLHGIRHHRALFYEQQQPKCPAMLTRFEDVTGRLAFIQILFLVPGEPPIIRDYGSASPGVSVGALARLFPAKDKLAITVGVEAALRFHKQTGLPSWAARNFRGLKYGDLPEHIQYVHIFAPHAQLSKPSRECILTLKHRLEAQGRTVSTNVDFRKGGRSK